MAKQRLIDLRVLYGAYDLSGLSNEFSVDVKVEDKDATTFTDLARRHLGSLQMGSYSIAGIEDDTTQPKAILFANQSANVVTSFIERGALAAEGDTGYSFRARQLDYEFGGAVGDLQPFKVGGQADSVIFVGQVAAAGTKTTSSNSTGIQLGAVAAGQKLYAALHLVLANSLTSFDVDIESDDNAGFSSATTRISFTQATGLTSEWKEVSGAITDDYWRATWTLVGTGAKVYILYGIF
jgi:hypothetical protein